MIVKFLVILVLVLEFICRLTTDKWNYHISMKSMLAKIQFSFNARMWQDKSSGGWHFICC